MTNTPGVSGAVQRRALLVSSTTLLAAGFYQSTLGPTLPDIAGSTSSDLAAVGVLFAALFVGSMASQLAAGVASERVGHRIVLIVGLLAASLGVASIAISTSLAMVVVAGLVAGLGNGALILGGNLVITDAFAERRTGAFNLSNVFFGVGAIGGPAMAGAMVATSGSAIPVLWIGAAVLLVPAGLALGLRLPPPTRPTDRDASPARLVLLSPFLWLTGLLIFIYLGSEVGVGGWLSTFLGRSAGTSRDAGALFTSGYWLALTTGRVLGAGASARLEAPRLLTVCLLGTVVGGCLLVASAGSELIAAIAALVLGVSFGPVYPTTIALVTSTFRAGASVAAGMVMALGSLGGALLPWLLGIIVVNVGPSAGALLILAFGVAMLGVWGLALAAVSASRGSHPRSAAAPSD
jgi:fucose permease